ncbi:hypothetical protein LINPERHAP2_LOCUS24447, partial [Linum perenne]
LFKCINKTPNRAAATTISAQPSYVNITTSNSEVRYVDKIKAFMDFRYITPGEAYWRLFKFDLYNNNTYVQRMSYHLHGQQQVFSNMNSTIDELLEAEHAHTSMLLEWMRMNKQHMEAQKYTFFEFPDYYVWTPKCEKWTPRQRKCCVGRIYNCPPSSNERFYLRMLLHIVKWCKSFEEIRIAYDIQYDSFQVACNAYGILIDDGE